MPRSRSLQSIGAVKLACVAKRETGSRRLQSILAVARRRGDSTRPVLTSRRQPSAQSAPLPPPSSPPIEGRATSRRPDVSRLRAARVGVARPIAGGRVDLSCRDQRRLMSSFSPSELAGSGARRDAPLFPGGGSLSAGRQLLCFRRLGASRPREAGARKIHLRRRAATQFDAPAARAHQSSASLSGRRQENVRLLSPSSSPSRRPPLPAPRTTGTANFARAR